MMGINCLGRANPAKNLGGCGLFRERKKQEVSRGFLVLVWSFLLILSFGCKTNNPCFLRLLPFPGPLSATRLSFQSLLAWTHSHLIFSLLPRAVDHSFSFCGFYDSLLSLAHLLQSSYLDEYVHPPLWVRFCLWSFPYLWICIFHLWIIFSTNIA